MSDEEPVDPMHLHAPGSPGVRLVPETEIESLRAEIDRLLAIEREARALVVSWDAHVYDSDGHELAALRRALEAKP